MPELPELSAIFAERALKADDLLLALVGASGTYLAITEQHDGKILLISDAWLSILGYTRKELAGKTVQGLNIWVQPTQRAKLIRQFKTDKIVDRFPARLRGKDGTLHDFSIALQSITITGKNYFLFTGHDVTENKLAEHAALASRQILVDALEAMSEGFVLYGVDGRLIICNSKFKEFYGYSDEEAAVGAHRRYLGELDVNRGTVLVSDNQRQAYIERREDLVKGPPKSFGIQLRDGRYLLLSDRRTEDGSIVSIHKDITDLKLAEISLVQAKEDADIANSAKSEFLAHMSHELRTPMNSILGFTQLMRDEFFGALGHPKYKEYITDVHRSGEHLLNLINDVLDISKVEAGEFTLHEEKLNLKDTVACCLQILRGKSSHGTGQICIEEPEADLFLLGDERIIRQIILNLLSNALKFTANGDKIILSLGKTTGQKIYIEVMDTGCGIAPGDLPRIMEPFGQARANARTAHEGTGLGLSLSKRFTELHGGTLSIQSARNEGTTVTITFPAERTMCV
ncbi:ATP-binding protein [Kiloniella laminariae]|uniref:histidine kinase n=1 Tax=Kiloniella laminariae TaxID=454162 RepID=A0ABT4LED0_9PROT|nr:PAS domain-containing sensor histidine kinase [Kiloniella laminariae]MCZ4279442.1 ATP-binding protein [Kiloniella laminariae]